MAERAPERRELQRKPIYDVVVVLGAGLEEKNGRVSPSLASKINAIAGYHALSRGVTNILVFSGGQTKGLNYPGEAETMWEFVERKYKKQRTDSKFRQLPGSRAIFENESWDTSTNLIQLKKLVETHGWRKVLILANDYHVSRVRHLAFNLGLESMPNLQLAIMPAEPLTWFRDPRHYQVTKGFYSSGTMKGIKRKERLLNALLKLDPQARIPRTISRLTRKRG